MKKLSMLLAVVLSVVFMAACSQQGAEKPSYADGTYRGAFTNAQDVEVEFVLKGGKFESLKFRSLGFKGEDYLKSEDPVMKGVAEQYQALADHLIGKDTSAIQDLYKPGNIAKDTDTFTAATLRAGKFISAINDALNRGLYKLPE